MYLLTALMCTLISGLLFLFSKDRKRLHLEVLLIIYGASSIMYLVDAIASAINKEGFLSMDFPIDGYIALWTFLGGLFLWLIIAFILNNSTKNVDKNTDL